MTRALILCGDGLNCESETAHAFELAGAKVSTISAEALIQHPYKLSNFDILAIPGGFSFGDEIASGQVLALKLKKYLKNELRQFIAAGKGIVGICNGFQVLAKLGLLPDSNFHKQMAITHNTSHEFIDRWVDLQVRASHCQWTQNLPTKIEMPIRHREGRVLFNDSKKYNEHIVFQYTEDINGSVNQIAGLTDKTGQILGLMPHPEAALYDCLMPNSSYQMTHTPCLQIFINAAQAFKGKSDEKN